MMKWKILYIAWILCSCSLGIFAQPEEIYSRLSEPAVLRPLTLYRGQFQINALLCHTMGNKLFDNEGSKLTFDKSARNYLANNFHFELGYGILDYIDFTATIAHYNEIETLPTYYILNMETGGEYNTLYQTKGLNNMNLLLRIRQPFTSNGFDIAFSGGISIPISSQDPLQPNHTIFLDDPSDPGGSYVLNFLFNPTPGYNTKFYKAAGELKYRSQRYSIYLGGSWEAPFSEEETLRWKHRLYGEQFQYNAESFQRMPSGELLIDAAAAIQPYKWFSCFINFRHHFSSGGWTEETGSRVSLPSMVLGTFSPGFEIQVTTHIRIFQLFAFPIYGIEHYAEFSIRSGLSINLVPFNNLYD